MKYCSSAFDLWDACQYNSNVLRFDINIILKIYLIFQLQAIYYTIFGYPEKDLNGQLAVITGGGGGLGRLLAMRLVRLGVKVILWDISQEGNKNKSFIKNHCL